MIELVDPNDARAVRENHYLIILSPSEIEFLKATADNSAVRTELSVRNVHELAVGDRILFG
jgi:hypothetical protein